MPTLSSLAAPEVVVMTTSGAASDEKVGITKNVRFRQCYDTLNMIIIILFIDVSSRYKYCAAGLWMIQTGQKVIKIQWMQTGLKTHCTSMIRDSTTKSDLGHTSALGTLEKNNG